MMRKWLGKRWVLLLVLAVFIICKVPHLSYPFYWDESWPYEAAIKAMYAHGPSLMPNAISSDLSRGHPLFFHAAAAVWMRIFGVSHVSQHSFALFIAVLVLILVYEAGLRMFNMRVAVMSLLLIATQVAFFVQASFMLPEVLLALLVFAALYFYTQNKFLLAGTALAALFFTKESGLVAGFVIGIDVLACLFSKRQEVKAKMYKLLVVAVPCVLIAAFFIVQKQLLGWYIYPLHTGLIVHNIISLWFNFKYNCVRNTFGEYLHYWYYLLLFVLGIIAAIKNKASKQVWFGIIVLTTVIIYCTINYIDIGYIKGGLALLLTVLSVAVLVKQLSTTQNEQQRKMVLLICAFIFWFFCFSAANFFTYRYLLEAFVPLFFLTAVLFDVLIARTHKVVYYPVLAVILLIGFFSFKNDTVTGDCDPGAYTAMEMEQGMVNYLEVHNDYDKIIGAGSYMNFAHLANAQTGLLHSDNTFKKVRQQINRTVDLAIFDSIEPNDAYGEIKSDTAFHRVYRYSKDNTWCEIYERE